MSETIVFFGSGPVAAKSLELLSKKFEIEAVITKPKPVHHKGNFPVLDVAEKLKLKILPVTDKKSLDQLMQTRPVNSRFGVLIDFGIIVSQAVIDYFPLGIVNSHFSLLPKLRGADPITFSILNGDAETGVSLMLLVEQMDAGPLLAQAPYELPNYITTPELTEYLIELSDQTLQVTLPLYLDNTVQPVPQNRSIEPTYSRKLTKDDGLIDWHKPAVQIEREVRAFIDWPKSRTVIGGREVILTKAKVVNKAGKPGEVQTDNRQLVVYAGKQALQILELKPSGKSAMSAQAFLAGYGHYL